MQRLHRLIGKPGLRTISTQYLLLLIPAISLLFITFGVVVYYLGRPEALKDNRELGEVIVKKTNQALARWLEEQIRTAQTIAHDPRVVEACAAPDDPKKREEAQKFLLEMHARHPYYENIPLALRLTEGRKVIVDVNGEKKSAGNGNFFIDTVGGKTIGKCGPHFNYIKNVFSGKPYFISDVYPSILRGKPIFVVAVPIERQGEIIGAAIVAPKMDYFTELFVEKSEIGDTGYLVMMDQSGMIISHPRKELILNARARELVRPVMDRIRAGETWFLSSFEGKRKAYYVEKLTTAQFTMQDNWYIFFAQDYDEIMEGIFAFLKKTLIGMVFVAFAVTFLVYLLTRKLITRPMGKLTRVANSVAEGNLLVDIERGEGKSEVGVLSRSIGNMAENLREQTAKILEAVDTLNATAAAIVAASGQQEEAMKGLEANVAQVGASSHEISSTSQELARTMDDVRNGSEDAARLAKDGQESLSGLQGAMQTLTRGTDVISDKLSLILQKAGNIDGIIETITRIADQTNLLSLNAAIEAEKAGEYGRGFSVVAMEIGRLANETAISTLDIMEIISEMQASVTDGVREMDHFRQGVTEGIRSADNAATQLSRVIEKVAYLSPEFDKVNEGMRFQSIGSTQISDAMADLNNSASQMTGSLSQFKAVTGQLNQAATRLRDAVSRFKI